MISVTYPFLLVVHYVYWSPKWVGLDAIWGVLSLSSMFQCLDDGPFITLWEPR